MPKPRSASPARGTIIFWAFMAFALVAGLGLYGATQLRANASGDGYVSTYQPPQTSQPDKEVTLPGDASLDPIRGILASQDRVVVSILGDSTGNSTGEWVDLWARDLGATKSVTLHLWNNDTEDWRPEVVRYGSGPEVVIWNASHPGASASYPLPRLDKMQPEKPALTLMSFGHNQTAQNAGSDQAATISAVSTKWGVPVPIVSILQNAGTEPRRERSAQNIAAVRNWAERSGVPTIDVFSAFEQSPNRAALIVDDGLGVHPNDAGSRLWADVVSAALNG